MTAPVQLVLAVVALVVSARTRLDAVILGRPVSVPVIGVIFLIAVLALLALILVLARMIVRDGGLRLRPRVATR